MTKMKKVFCVAMILLFVAGSVFAGGGSQRTASGKISVVAVPKLKSAWFDAFNAGLMKAAKDFDTNSVQQDPPTADEATQVRFVRDAMNQGANALLVVPNDANSLVPVFSDARKRGIAVLTHESPDQPEADYNVEMIMNEAFGRRYVDEMVKITGATGEYAIYVGSLTVPAHNIWADAAEKQAREKYPGLKLVAPRFPVAEDRELSRQTALDIIKTYPNLKGFVIFGSQGSPGAALALRELGLVDRIVIVGGGTPDESRPFIKDGSWNTVILWDSGEAAYAMTYIAKLILEGKKSEIKPGFSVPTLGTPQIQGINILFDKPLILTKDNIDNYHF
jgi:simple sugar transport system substrate-binding protein